MWWSIIMPVPVIEKLELKDYEKCSNIWNMDTFEYGKDPNFVDVYSKDAAKLDLGLKVSSAEGGNKVTVDFDLDTENAWQLDMEEDLDIDVVVVISSTASNFPSIPAAVQSAKEDALARFNWLILDE